MGLAICYDLCYPQMYAAYREKGVELMLHSFYNARSVGPEQLGRAQYPPGAYAL